MKRLLIVVPALKGGGAEKFCRTLAEKIDAEKFEVKCTIFTGNLEPNLPFEQIVLPQKRFFWNLRSLFKVIRQVKPDYLFSSHGYINIALLFLVKVLRISSTKVVIRESSIASIKNKREKWPILFNLCYQKLYPFADRIICQSTMMLSDFQINYSISTSIMRIVNNPLAIKVDGESLLNNKLASYPVGKRTLKFVFVGRLSPIKKVHLIIRSLKESFGTDFQLTVIGAGTLRQVLMNLVQELGLSEQVAFTGYQDDPTEWVCAADFLLLYSEYEGFPNVVLEALSVGVPCVVFGCTGGVWDLIEKFPEAFIAEKENWDQLILKLKKAQEFVPKLDYQKFISEYQVDGQVRRFEEILDEIAE